MRALSAFWNVTIGWAPAMTTRSIGLSKYLKNTLAARTPGPGEQLPAGVDVLDQRALEIGVAAHRAAADDVGELERGQLAELGAVHRRAVAEPQVHVRPQRLDEVDAREESVFLFSAVTVRTNRPNGSKVLTSWSKFSTRAPAISRVRGRQRDVDHAVAGDRGLIAVVGVDRPGLLVEAEGRADVVRREQLLGRLRRLIGDDGRPC